ncbi:MAG: alanine--tRNA ligase, partial [Verrucomicrobiae bacterium]|nr:alanine--tRNA ligase [Verrucomicrobiae bacterium]
LFVITDKTVFYAEMGGQVGDTGVLVAGGTEYPVTAVQQIGKARAHLVSDAAPVKPGDTVTLRIDAARRRPIEAHHSATHLLHWALHEIVSRDAAQQGSSVDEHRLRFDFNSAAITPAQIAAMEESVNARIAADDPVSWREVPHAEVKGRDDVMQFFGDKYGDRVRVVQIGGKSGELDGYSMELCGGTHVRHTGEIGLFKIKSEGAIAAGIRRVEAVCGDAAWAHLNEVVGKWDADLKAARAKLAAANEKLAALGEAPVTVNDFPHIMGAMLAERADIAQINATFAHGQRTLDETNEAAVEAEKRLKKLQAGAAAKAAGEWLENAITTAEGDAPKRLVAQIPGDNADLLQEALNGLKQRQFPGVALLAVVAEGTVHIGASVHPDYTATLKAGDLVRELTAVVGGKGGGRPEMARGAGPGVDQLDAMLAKARELVGN